MFGFNTILENPVNYIFNLNHLLLILSVGAFIVALLFIFRGKTEKSRKITMIITAFVLFILEILFGKLSIFFTRELKLKKLIGGGTFLFKCAL